MLYLKFYVCHEGKGKLFKLNELSVNKMPAITADTEKIMREAIIILDLIKKNEIDKNQIELLLRDIVETCRKLLSEESGALQRIGMDLQEIFGGEERASNALKRLGIDFRKLFG